MDKVATEGKSQNIKLKVELTNDCKDMSAQHRKVKSKLDDSKLKSKELEKYTNISKGGIIETRLHLEKLYTSAQKLDE